MGAAASFSLQKAGTPGSEICELNSECRRGSATVSHDSVQILREDDVIRYGLLLSDCSAHLFFIQSSFKRSAAEAHIQNKSR